MMYRFFCSLFILLATTGFAQKQLLPETRNPKRTPALDNLSVFPEAVDSQQRIVIILPAKANESDFRIELMAGKTVLVDKCNRHFMGGSYNVRQIDGYGYDYYQVESEGIVGGTLMACADNSTQSKFVSVIQDNLIRYNSKLPLVVYVPRDFEVRYRIWSAGKTQVAAKALSGTAAKGLRDCPEELVVNTIPTISKKGTPDRYYIYQGKRREVNEFDAEWLRLNCRIKVTDVQ